MRKFLSIVACISVLFILFTSCANMEDGELLSHSSHSGFDDNKNITVVARESESGTRNIFNKHYKISTEGTGGVIDDKTVSSAIISTSTVSVMNKIKDNEYAVGYISMGSHTNDVKVLKVDGVTPNQNNIKDGSYKNTCPFNLITKGDVTGLKKDFIDFIISHEGQTVIGKEYHKEHEDAAKHNSETKYEGKLTVGGSSAMAPIMQKLIDEYKKHNEKAEIELRTSNSKTGITGADNGSLDIGLSVRELTTTEKTSLKETKIATDAIIVIVNKNNNKTDITSNEVMRIFTGEITSWKF